ncbi:MAG: hypothetical protein HYU78_01280 [Rhodocyclales bacterium]|nr:hypothetical protein [Rhodocyclales bacterium]
MRKLTYRDIRVACPLGWDVFDAAGTLLLRRGYIVETEKQMRGLIERGLYVTDDNLDGVSSEPASPPEICFDPFWLWDDIQSKLARILRDIESQEFAEDRIAGLALLVCALADKDPDAALGAILLKDTERYAYTHVLHVAVMAAIISKKLDWNDGERRDLVCVALSMNVAMISLQTALTKQDTPLSEEQRRAVEAHPKQGSDMLRRAGIRNERWLRAVELHHSRQHLAAESVARPDAAAMAELVRTLDIFCAKISARTYRQALLPPIAARELFVRERDQNSPFLGPLIKEVGLYMPGTFLKLNNGDLALSVRRGVSVDTPRVVALSRGDGAPYLEAVKRDTARPEFSVRGVVPRDKVLHRLNLPRFWGYAR